MAVNRPCEITSASSASKWRRSISRWSLSRANRPSVTGALVASHRRSYGRHEDHLELDHYLKVLARKPGALRDAKPWRQVKVPACYRRLFEELKGSTQGCREFLDVLTLRRDGDMEAVDRAVDTAVDEALGRRDVIEQILRQQQEETPTLGQSPVDETLKAISVPVGDLARYDTLTHAERRLPA